MLAAILYFSRAGENFLHGQIQHLTIGNTAVVAQKLAQQLAIEPHEIQPAVPYPIHYQEAVTYVQVEKDTHNYPDYQPLTLTLQNSQHIFLGYPIWWGSLPMIVKGVLQQHTLSGKYIYPFCTHEGSGLGNSLTDIHYLCPDATVLQGLAIRGSCVDRSDTAIANWLKQYHYHLKEESSYDKA